MNNIEQPKGKISEKIELLVELMKVKSSVNENITEDYTLAYLDKAEKEFITENYANAEYGKNIISKFSKGMFRNVWDDKKGDWIRNEDGSVRRFGLTEEEKKIIESLATKTFNFFMINPHLIAILNRNKNDNFIMKLLGKDMEEEKPVNYGTDDRNILSKIKDRLFGEEEVVEESD